ncbi:MAG: exodeoxyribonuclease VII large subunit [Myxococcota bacterium]
MTRPWGQRPRRTNKEARVYRVAEVNRAARDHIEAKFSSFWVEGEISQATKSAAGHVYFTLSDEREQARIDGVVYATDLRRVRADLEAGARVRVLGNLTIWEKTGRYQIRARQILPAGEGDLRAQFENIRKRLAAEGLLDEERKRPLPRVPRVVGVVTSVGSAALRDVVRVAQERSPTRLLVADCRVSGQEAERSIVAALTQIQRVPDVDVIILGRGGGSAEELWAFNSERVARAVAASRIPVVCGVGHETDITIAELVADRRASTPSNAAEQAVPERAVLLAELDGFLHRLQRAMVGRFDQEHLRLQRVERRLADPRLVLAGARRRFAELEQAAALQVRAQLRARKSQVQVLETRLRQRDPRSQLAADRARVADLNRRLERAIKARLAESRKRLLRVTTEHHAHGRPIARSRRSTLQALGGRLDALSPLRVLERGYAIAFGPDGNALRAAKEVSPGDSLRVRLHDGEVEAEVTATRDEE